jgi:hypothetical protein
MINSTDYRSKWKRVSREHRCPICERPDWCLFTGDADIPDAVICARTPSPKRCGEAGWLHRLRLDWDDRPRRRRAKIEVPSEPIDFGAMAQRYYLALGDHLRGLLANGLGVTAESLHRLGVGWSERHRATTWPMTDAAGTVRGIRLRGTDGAKWSVRGGKEGLFAPGGLATDGRIIVCEGGTDTAAMLGLDFFAVGRPSCTGGAKLLIDLVECDRPHEVAIIADSDPPGQRGAKYLASRLVGYVAGGVRIVNPPPAVKDAREWVQSLGTSWERTRYDVLEAIEGAPVLTLTYTRREAV